MHLALKRAICLTSLSLALTGMTAGQSLGDVARDQKQKPQKKAAKVFTNEDLPQSEASGDPTPHSEYGPTEPLGSKSAEQWKSEIAAQKQSIDSLQNEITRISSSVHFVQSNRYYYGGLHNERQEQKMEHVEELKQQLADQQRKLADMQEAARKEGFGNAVYEP